MKSKLAANDGGMTTLALVGSAFLGAILGFGIGLFLIQSNRARHESIVSELRMKMREASRATESAERTADRVRREMEAAREKWADEWSELERQANEIEQLLQSETSARSAAERTLRIRNDEISDLNKRVQELESRLSAIEKESRSRRDRSDSRRQELKVSGSRMPEMLTPGERVSFTLRGEDGYLLLFRQPKTPSNRTDYKLNAKAVLRGSIAIEPREFAGRLLDRYMDVYVLRNEGKEVFIQGFISLSEYARVRDSAG